MCKNKSVQKSLIRLPELLAPAGNFEKLVTAIYYGADAVYLGGKEFSLRAKATNFTLEKMEKGISYAHDKGVQVYVTVNIIGHNRDFEKLPEYLKSLQSMGADGLIISDPGILSVAKRMVPALPVHLSTQANVTNSESAAFWFGLGVERINLARELSLHEIEQIKQRVMGELEVFVHGALCISYSGRCLLSSYLTDRDANQGNCSHPCRFSYSLVEEKRPGEYFSIEEDDRGTYIFNSKDLCLLEVLPQLLKAGVDSLKIEGRMKSIFYVGGVVRVYRAVLDYLKDLPAELWQRPEDIILPEKFVKEIQRIGTRGNTENFINSIPGSGEMIYKNSRLEQSYEPVAVIRGQAEAPLVEIRNTVKTLENIEHMGRGLESVPLAILEMRNEKGELVQKANPGNIVKLVTRPTLEEGEVHSFLRRKKRQ